KTDCARSLSFSVKENWQIWGYNYEVYSGCQRSFGSPNILYMKRFCFLIVIFHSVSFAHQNQDVELTSFLNYLKHFSAQDSGTIFFHSYREDRFMDFSSKTTNSFSFVKQQKADTPFLFLETSINELGETNTYFQD